ASHACGAKQVRLSGRAGNGRRRALVDAGCRDAAPPFRARGHRDQSRNHARFRLRLTILRARLRRRRGSSDRLSALRAGALLGSPIGKTVLYGIPGLAARRRASRHARRRSCSTRRPRGHGLPRRAEGMMLAIVGAAFRRPVRGPIMKRMFVLGALLVSGALSIAVAAQQAQTKQVIDVQKVADNYYVLTSSTPGNDATFSGGNVGVFITNNGIVLVDTKLAGWGQTFLERVKSISTKPVTTIINTHTHGDHTGNDDKFGTSVEIIAQENTKTNMAKMDAFKGDKAWSLPTRTLKAP